MNPSNPLRVVPTHVRMAAMTGAEHGAATNPDAAPITRAAAGELPPPACEAFVRSADGIGTGITSNMTSANTRSRFAITKYDHGLELTDPNNVPVRPAMTPRVAYTTASPMT